MKFITPPLGLFVFACNALALPSSFHTFTPPPSGSDITWPDQIVDEETLSHGYPLNTGYYQGWLEIYNQLNNTLFIDDDYFATGSAPNISGRAMWGNPRSGFPLEDADLYFHLDQYFSADDNDELVDEVTRVAFEFAWATSDHLKVLDDLQLEVIDYYGNMETVHVTLDQTFYHNLATGAPIPTGRYGKVVLEVGENVSLENIYQIRFANLWETNPGGEQGEFAIDNLSISGSGGGNSSELGPVSYDGTPLTGYSTTALKTGNLFGLSDRIYNGGGESTTFSINWVGSSPFIYQPQPIQNRTIAPDEFIDGAFSWEVNTAVAPSGRYTGEFTLVNEGNPSDTENNTLTLVYFDLFDRPIISDNAGPIAVGGQATISNAPVAGHPGALRASLMLKQVLRSNPRFTVSGMAAANLVNSNVTNAEQSIVLPGQTLTGNIGFNAAGAASGTHTGVLRLKLEMTSGEDYYLNDKEPVADRVWALSYTVPPKPLANPAVTPGQDLAEAGIDISGSDTGAAIVGGTSSSSQSVSLSFVGNPPVTNASGHGSAVALDFGASQQLYVLQLSYQDLASNLSELDLRIQSLSGGSWIPAISLNGNGGASVTGAQPYAGSYPAYLASLGGGALDSADLGAFGVDVAGNTAWIVLDYEGTFQLTTGSPVAQPQVLGFSYNRVTNSATISYQSQLGVAFEISGGSSLDSLEPIGTTPVGTGGIMQYQHTPTGSPSRFFYSLTRP